jgi:hypothetical protein
MRQRANLQVSRGDEWDALSRPKSSQDVVETSLVLVLPLPGMSFRTEAGTGIRDGARAATLMGGKAATRPLAVRSATGRLQRVRAFMRVTRRAARSTCGRNVSTSGVVWLTPYGSRREPVTPLSDAGGPGPLTEDRQKTETRL